MSSYFFRFLSFVKYFFTAKNEHSIHAPFLYELYTKCIKIDLIGPQFTTLEAVRKSLLKNGEQISVSDFGTGTKAHKKIKEIASKSLILPKYARLQYRLIDKFKPNCVLELGTSLGISSAYFSLAAPQAKIYTLEGSKSILEIAKHLHQQLGVSNIEYTEGNFDDTLPVLLNKLKYIDYVYIDGNHRKTPTLAYFKWILPHVHENTVMIVDDIYWSAEMNEAWKEIIENNKVTLSLDFYRFGVVFFSKNLSKEHFVLRY